MKREDERILEYLDEEHWSTPKLIATEAFEMISAEHVEERLLFLGYAGLVDRLHSNSYEITPLGQRYLEGELDVSHLPRPTPSRVLSTD